MYFLASLNGPIDNTEEKDAYQYAAVYELSIKLTYVTIPVWAIVLCVVGGAGIIAAVVIVVLWFRRKKQTKQYVTIG